MLVRSCYFALLKGNLLPKQCYGPCEIGLRKLGLPFKIAVANLVCGCVWVKVSTFQSLFDDVAFRIFEAEASNFRTSFEGRVLGVWLLRLFRLLGLFLDFLTKP